MLLFKREKKIMQGKVALFVNLFRDLDSVQKTQEEVQVSHS